MTKFTHLDAAGRAHMVDVGDKESAERRATAEGWIVMQELTVDAIEAQAVAKGDVLAVARVAGIMAAKRTADLVPLCHPIALTSVSVDLQVQPQQRRVYCSAEAKTRGPTGVEMEALTAVQVALLTVYDMCKALDRGMEISGVRLVHKSGGRSGQWQRGDQMAPPVRGEGGL